MVTLETTRLFRNLDAAELDVLGRIARELPFSAGQPIFKQGEPGDGIYMVKGGLVEISANVTPGAERVIAQVQPGEFFGEMAVLELKPRSATARAAQGSVVYFIPRDELLAMVQRSPALALELLREISQRLREFDQRYIQEMLQAERLSVIGRFARSIVHDLKNPLNIIGLSAEMATMQRATPESRQKAASTIRGQVDRISDLIGEILEFTQGSRADYVLGLSDYSAFTRQVLDEIRPEVELRGVKLESGVPPAALRLAFDSKRLRRVFDNLIHNATDALTDGGTIFVRFRVEGNDLLTEIEDTGAGIAPEIAGKLFEVFATYGKAHGTGLGLSICKRIVEDHHGRIWARNKPGGGAVFCFALPLPKGS
jgi:signal transduction histidine kinase